MGTNLRVAPPSVEGNRSPSRQEIDIGRPRVRAEELAGLSADLKRDLAKYRGRSWLRRQWEKIDSPVLFVGGVVAGGVTGYTVARAAP